MDCATSTASRSPAWSSLGPRATTTPTCRPARSRSWPARSRSSTRPRRCRSRSTSASRSARRRGSSTAISTCAGRHRRAAIRLRSKVNQAARDVLLARDFVEIETPTLTRSTPEGARDFLVPARLRPGNWYALPQSPQLFKQLLMVAGMERYFQIARCYRDEDFRADRQPEFTQLDVEMSFVDTGRRHRAGRAAAGGALGADRRRGPDADPADDLRRRDGALRHGQAGPAVRAGAHRRAPAYFADTPFRVFQAPYVGAVVMPGGGVPAAQDARRLAGVGQAARARGLAYVLVGEDGELGGPVAKNLSDAERAGLAAQRRREARRLHLLRRRRAAKSAGAARRGPAGDRPRGRTDRRVGLVVRLGRRRAAVRAVVRTPWRPVTSPSAPAPGPRCTTRSPRRSRSRSPRSTPTRAAALAYAYDIVCNGNEIGGGSIRIHRRDIQERVFAVMGLSEEEAQEKFGFLLDAFAFGAPPHGGIAFGWDRICALLSGTDSIRDVIAFPKSGGGVDPLTAAPAPITPQQRKEAGIDATPA